MPINWAHFIYLFLHLINLLSRHCLKLISLNLVLVAIVSWDVNLLPLLRCLITMLYFLCLFGRLIGFISFVVLLFGYLVFLYLFLGVFVFFVFLCFLVLGRIFHFVVLECNLGFILVVYVDLLCCTFFVVFISSKRESLLAYPVTFCKFVISFV